MGCCIARQEQQNNQIPNKSITILKQIQEPSKQKSSKYREQGKKYFNSRLYDKSVEAYNLALVHDPLNPVNYSNLALAQKVSGKFQESILTIKRMEKIQILNSEQIIYFVKGQIIKARCQTILAKNKFVQQKQAINDNSFRKAQNLIKQAVDTLQGLISNAKYKQLAQKLNAPQYLQSSIKIKHIITRLNNKFENNELLTNFLKNKLKQKKAHEHFSSFNMIKHYQKPEDTLKDIMKIQEQRNKNLIRMYNDQQKQFTIDPITYEQYKSPIIVKSGLTYEEQTLKLHYKKNGHFDPITKQKYNQELGIRNNTLAAYIQQTKKLQHLNELKQIDL